MPIVSPNEKKQESLKDSFFEDEPYIGHTAHRSGVSGVEERLASIVEANNPDAHIGL